MRCEDSANPERWVCVRNKIAHGKSRLRFLAMHRFAVDRPLPARRNIAKESDPIFTAHHVDVP